MSRGCNRSAGRTVTRVVVSRAGVEEHYSADIVVVACGALSSALLLLRSANESHHRGLANSSDQVGRNFMRHNQSILMALMREPNETVFQKTLAVTDYYFGADDWDYPLGLIQMCAASHGAQIRDEVLPDWLEWCPRHPSGRWRGIPWISGCPAKTCRGRRTGSIIGAARWCLDITEGNMEAHHRLRKKLEQMLGRAGRTSAADGSQPLPRKGHPHWRHGPSGRHRPFRRDPSTSVLDINCKAHDLDNLYVTDASFFPSIGAVNPTLTIIANALRVADIIRDRLA